MLLRQKASERLVIEIEGGKEILHTFMVLVCGWILREVQS
jgi:hypothetical protein